MELHKAVCVMLTLLCVAANAKNVIHNKLRSALVQRQFECLIDFSDDATDECAANLVEFGDALDNSASVSSSLDDICRDEDCYNAIYNFYNCIGLKDFGKVLCLKQDGEYCFELGYKYEDSCADCEYCTRSCSDCITDYNDNYGCCVASYQELEILEGVDLNITNPCGVTFQCSDAGAVVPMVLAVAFATLTALLVM